MAPELHTMVQDKVFHEPPQIIEEDDLDTSPRVRM
jgi:hypothetical protein